MKKIFWIFSLLLVFISCNDDEIANDVLVGSEIVGFKDTTANIAYFENIGAVNYDLIVELKGLGDGQLPGNDIEVNYTFVNGTATLGTEFSNPNASNKVTIPAGSTFVKIPVTVNTGNMNATMPTEAYVDITTNTGNTVVSEKAKRAKLVFIGCQTNLEGTYKYGTTKISTITKIAPNKYHATYMPAFASTYWFEFTDTCGVLQITDWQFQGGNPMFVTGDSESLPTGYITAAGNLVFTHCNVTGVSWYVDLTWTLVKQ